MADSYVVEKLTEWGFSDFITSFKDQEIDRVAFLALDNDQAKELIAKLGPRAKLIMKLKEIRLQKKSPLAVTQDPNSTESNNLIQKSALLSPSKSIVDIEDDLPLAHQSTSQNIITELQSPKTPERSVATVVIGTPVARANSENTPLKYNIEEILASNYPKGPILLETLKASKPLSKPNRIVLVQLLVQELNRRHGLYPKSDQKEELARDLVATYPILRDTSPSGYARWYSPCMKGKKGGCTGVVQTRVTNVQKDYRKSNKSTTDPAVVIEQDITDVEPDPDLVESQKQWLIHNMAPKEKVQSLMTETRKSRIQWIHGKDQPELSQILTEYPRYKDEDGFEYIDADFSEMYPDTANTFICGWKEIAKVLKASMQNGNISDPMVLKMLKESEDSEAAVLVGLPALIPQGYLSQLARSTSGSKRSRGGKPSIMESRASFIDIKATGSNIEEYRNEKQDYYTTVPENKHGNPKLS